MTEENKGYPAGSVKTSHVELEAFKLNGKIGIGRTGKGVKLSYEDGKFNKTWKLPEGKFQGKALTVPANKALWSDLEKAYEAFEEDDEQVFTVTSEKGDDYWELTGIQVGKHGVAGIVKPGGSQPQSSGGSGGGWDGGKGAGMGQLRTISSELAIKNSTKTQSMVDVMDNAKEYLKEEGLPEKMAEFYQASEDLWDAFQKALGGTKPVTKSEPVPASDDDIEDDEDMDEDIPY